MDATSVKRAIKTNLAKVPALVAEYDQLCAYYQPIRGNVCGTIRGSPEWLLARAEYLDPALDRLRAVLREHEELMKQLAACEAVAAASANALVPAAAPSPKASTSAFEVSEAAPVAAGKLEVAPSTFPGGGERSSAPIHALFKFAPSMGSLRRRLVHGGADKGMQQPLLC